MKNYLSVLLFLLVSISVQAQSTGVSVQQLDSLLAIEKKPVLFFIHTDWCRYCLMMERQVFSDSEIAAQLNKDFYFVMLNAEDEKDIAFAGRTFQFQSTGSGTGIHELAKELGTINGTITYPTLVVMNDAMEITFQHGQAMKRKQFKSLLKIAR